MKIRYDDTMIGWLRANLYARIFTHETLCWGADAATLTAEKQHRHSFTVTLPVQRLKINENILSNWYEKDRLSFDLCRLRVNDEVEVIITNMKK